VPRATTTEASIANVIDDPRPKNASAERRPQVILCGPFPESNSIGGYARYNGLVSASFLNDRFGIERLPLTVPGDGGFLRRMAVDLRQTRRRLRECPAAIFHLTAQYQLGTYREYAIYREAKRQRRSFVYDIRAGTFIECYEAPNARLRRRLLREMLEGADAVTAQGRSYVRWLEAQLGLEATWIPNLVSARQRGVYPTAPLERPASGDPIRLVYAGRLVPTKGLEETIEACGDLEKGGIVAELHAAGPGAASYRDTLERDASRTLARSRLIFHGALDHDRLLRLLATCHVFVFPTRWIGEGHPNAINEAMQVGLPIVATRHGFIEDVVTPDCGVLLPAPDGRLVAHAIADLTADWDRLRSCGAAAQQRVYRAFSDEVVLGRLAEVYERLLRQRGS
jgi:glycosyltransferase involved in cell wall biosynthesis